MLLFTATLPLFAALNVAVSIVPQQTFLKAIGGDLVTVTTMVPPGSSPHTYEPKASQMKALSSASLYFAIGVEFESAWLKRFSTTNPDMRVIDLTHGIEKIPMQEHDHHHDGHHDDTDPHIWLSPANVAIMARIIAKTLSEYDPEHAKTYRFNLDLFLEQIEATDGAIKSALSLTPEGSAFMVFHPSWGYFAHDYRLKQVAMEIEGKAPKPKMLIHLIEEAKKQKVRAIIVQPEFSDKSARVLADELGISVKKLSPLNPNWSENLIELARTIAK